MWMNVMKEQMIVMHMLYVLTLTHLDLSSVLAMQDLKVMAETAQVRNLKDKLKVVKWELF